MITSKCLVLHPNIHFQIQYIYIFFVEHQLHKHDDDTLFHAGLICKSISQQKFPLIFIYFPNISSDLIRNLCLMYFFYAQALKFSIFSVPPCTLPQHFTLLQIGNENMSLRGIVRQLRSDSYQLKATSLHIPQFDTPSDHHDPPQPLKCVTSHMNNPT